MSEPAHEGPFIEVNAEVRSDPWLLAEAIDALARRRAPGVHRSATALVALAALLFAAALWTLIRVHGQTLFVLLALVVAPCLALVLPYSRARIVALLLRVQAPSAFTPFRIVRLSPSVIFTTDGKASSAIQIDAFPDRIETARFFALGLPDRPIPVVFPKRGLDADVAEALRAMWARTPSAASTVDAVRTFGDGDPPGALRFTPDADEQYRGFVLMSGKAKLGAGKWGFTFFLFLAAWLEYVHGRDVRALFLAVVGVGLPIALRHRIRAKLQVVPTTLVLDDDALRVSASMGDFAWKWDEIARRLEDDAVLVIVVRKGLGFVVPKRALTSDALATLRARIRA